MRLLRKLVALALIIALLIGGVIVWQTVVLSSHQRLKTQYFSAVCDIQPMWFGERPDGESVGHRLQQEIEDTTTELQARGADPARAEDLLSYLLQVEPASILWYNANYTITQAVKQGLLRKNLTPTMDEAAAKARSATIHEGHKNTYDAWILSLREKCPTPVFGLTLGDG